MFSQVLQRGATESPTKPKGRPKKDSYDDIPGGVQDQEHENSEYADSDSDTSRDGLQPSLGQPRLVECPSLQSSLAKSRTEDCPNFYQARRLSVHEKVS